MPAIFRITSIADWQTALATGAVPRCAADNRDDCIHVNAADDVARVASAFFSADERPVALELDQLALAQHLTWLAPSQAKPWPQGRAALPNILISHVLGVHELLPVPRKPSDDLAPCTLSSIFLIRTSGSRRKTPRNMGIKENKQVVRSFYDAADRGDMDACFALLADDVKWTNIGTTRFSGTYTGKQALIEQLLGPLFARLKAGIATTIEDLTAEADVVVAQTTGAAETHQGVPYNNSYCQVIRIRDGKIAEVKEYFDTELTSSVFGPG